MPLQKQYDRTEVLEQATFAFWRRGYEGTTISDLVEQTGLNRGSLYTAFDGKRGLFIECLNYYDMHHRQDFLDEMSKERTPSQAVLAVFEAAARPSHETGLPPGCLMVNSALEVSPHDPELREVVNKSLSKVEAFFERKIREAKADGSIPPSVDAQSAAKALLGLFLGVRVLVRSGADETTISTVINQARNTLT